MRTNKTILYILWMFFTMITINVNAKIVVKSPNKSISLKLKPQNGQLYYSINYFGKKIINSSKLSISNAPIKILSTNKLHHDTNWKPVWGQFSSVRNHYNETSIHLISENKQFILHARVYNDGVAFQYEKTIKEQTSDISLYCEYNVPNLINFYTSNQNGDPYKSITNIEAPQFFSEHKKKAISAPIVMELEDDQYMALWESDLFNTKDFETITFHYNEQKKTIFSKNKGDISKVRSTSPWRVILISNNIGDFTTSQLTLNLAKPNQLKETKWIHPGKALWDWRVHGHQTDDGFTYGIDTESYKRYIDFAASNHIRYFLIDDLWYKKVTKGHFILSDKLDIKQVIKYAEEKGVEIILYYDRRHGNYGEDALYAYYASLNMKGMKYGFMGRNIPFTKKSIMLSAKNHLLIDYHDCPAPMTGVSRTYPNMITREYCHAQQDSRKAFTPEKYINMSLINAITGPLDMNNGNFDILEINNGGREKGPKKLNSYPTTVVSEAARTLITFTGLTCLPDAPDVYKKKSDLFTFIKQQPTGKWDESIVLQAKMNQYISTARRAKDEWFIGTVISQKGGTLPIQLSFLEEGKKYTATLYEDTQSTDCYEAPEHYQIRTIEVTKNQVIDAKMAKGGGHCIWIKPIQ
ncbi:glycoside hydrolase family 97 protein [Halosquirtibacter xylanolyticus]|uniref:glycoside hydrolase family 97 protein n=1 Tax=Halosquirtibacter xylanolyticus TaxID=3374599 RepID=UPI0037478359|nr:glycoside hydrolase family 97 protein [Prolixibacteraceae bacterium]